MSGLETVQLNRYQQDYFPNAESVCLFFYWFQYVSSYYVYYETYDIASLDDLVISHQYESFATPYHYEYHRYPGSKVEEYALAQYDRLIYRMPVYRSYMARTLGAFEKRGSFALWNAVSSPTKKVKI